ncbi:hypothetical protein [Pseudomonas coronafaciens]|uniref:Uncharacterized protein n=1 Tax=Pseudomonas coronafaciens pv. coronafaciens TaxID=235275 RepID=A0AAE6QI60_9PSED|nr:hypothetical protein [Pseudomonas coronafaciens]QGT82959.1 hypothetical protein GMO17_18165 [Pseudomonas coronafaciens pv. coronafaciens]
MFGKSGNTKTPQWYRSTTWICYSVVLLLIAAAVAAPLYAYFGSWRPAGETEAIWLQRSGAVTTLFSFMAGAMSVFAGGRLYTPGFFGDKDRLTVLAEFKKWFRFAEALIFGLSIIGTAVWGYGDLMYTAFHSD